MKILVTGASSALGQELCPLLEKENWQFWATNSKILDITNTNQIQELKEKVSLDFIIHLAAFTNIEEAEINPTLAYEINQAGTKNIAKIAAAQDIPILYVSPTDVFDGKKKTPYTKKDKTNPINVYGKSKLLGEQEIKKYCKKHYILRTGWLYGKGSNDYVYGMLTFSNFKSEIDLVDNQTGSPTWTRDLSEKIIEIIKNKTDFGTHHIASSGSATWEDFTKEIFAIRNKNVKIKLGSEYEEFGAKRPQYCVLESDITLPKWEESLKKYLIGK